ncbi:hypothetical protein [Archangium lansingense]|uniref:Uncharacterized protein n=1 Tax=Archangium lansingense TaxID=2995310 RepID=A0ABT4A424_9BACT|nr:hypothetical protein [Archangium lansinium]MCY1076397.1 hypothetical protein [Archangium lansinium]
MSFKIGPKMPEVFSQPTRPAAPPPPPPRPAREPASSSRFDSTQATAQRQKALSTTGANEASTLRTEVLGDGRANCLEKAVRLAGPGDSIVLMHDGTDGVGHALVQRQDGSVLDPNYPQVRYETLGQWQALNPRYGNPVTAGAGDVRQALAVPPGAQRDAVLSRLGLLDEASVRVADPETEVTASGGGLEQQQGISFGADGKITYTEQTSLNPTEFEFERGQLGATLQAGPYANTEVSLEWNPNSPTANGTYAVTVTYGAEAGAQLNGGATYGPYGLSGGVAAGASSSAEYTLFLTQAQMEQAAQGTYPLPSIADPLSLPEGGAMTLEAGAFHTQSGSISYGGLTLSSESTRTNGYSVAAERTGDSTVRITVGPKDTLENNFGFGLSFGDDASLTMTRNRTTTNENLVSVEFDLGTAQGQAAYETFLRTGALPTAEGPGVSGLFHEQTYTYEGALEAGLELGPLSIGGELWSESAVITRRMEDGVESLTTQDSLANGTSISGSFVPSPDGNHQLDSISFTLNPNSPNPLTLTVNGEEGFQSLRQAAAEQLQHAVIETLAQGQGMTREETIAWMQSRGEPLSTLAVPPSDPNFSYEGFLNAFNEQDVRNGGMPTMPPMTATILNWQPGEPYLPVFTQGLAGSTNPEELMGSEGTMSTNFGGGVVPVPSLFDIGLQNLPGIEVVGR